MGFPLLRHARFTSEDGLREWEVGEILEREESFEGVVKALERAGFALEAVRYEDVFADRAPPARPEAMEDLNSLYFDDEETRRKR